jgi:integrase/recombinase XerC
MAPFFVLESFLQFLLAEKRFSKHTLTAYENDIKQFFDFSQIDSDQSLVEINHQLVRSWVVTLVDQGLVSKTINRKISSLRTFVKWCQANNYIHHNPLKKIVAPKISKKLPQFIKESDLKESTIVDFFKDDFNGLRNQLIIEVLYQTGIRLSELVNLKINNIQEESIKVLGKRNKERIIPISYELRLKIQVFITLRESISTDLDLLFILENGKKIYDRLVYRIINTYLSFETNLEKKSPHVLRHTFATHMMNNGAGLEVLKDLLGHANLSATQVYTHNSFSQLNNIYSQAHPRGQKK